MRNAMEERGVQFIINRSAIVRRDGAELPLVGIDEVYRGEPDLEADECRRRRDVRVSLDG